MANYLVTKFKGQYRILPELDLETNDIPRDPEGNIDEDAEVFIACQQGNKIRYWGNGILIGYVPSLGRGRNIKKAMDREGIEYFNYDESDEEIMFHFKAKDIEPVAELMKAKTSGAGISPFSSRNLPKSNVEIPTNEMARYKDISKKVDKSDLLLIKNINASFLSDILEKSLRKLDRAYNYKSDMKKLKMSRQVKEFIWTKGFWEEYLDYLDNEVEAYYNSK